MASAEPMAGMENAVGAEIRRVREEFGASIEALRSQLDETHADMQARLRELEERAAGASSPTAAASAAGAPPVDVVHSPQIASAMAFIAKLVRETLRGVHELEGGSLDTRTLALAHDAAVQSSKQADDEAVRSRSKQAAIYLRDLLVLKVCLADGQPWDNPLLLQAFGARDVFYRQIDKELSSKLLLAFNTIVRCGRSRDDFEKAAKKVYGGDAEEEWLAVADDLFEAFRACAATSPNYESHGKSVRKNKGPKRANPQAAPASPSGTSEVLDEQSSPGATSSTDGARTPVDDEEATGVQAASPSGSASGDGAEVALVKDPLDESGPWKLQSLLPTHMRVKNGFFDPVDDQKSCSGSDISHAMTVPARLSEQVVRPRRSPIGTYMEPIGAREEKPHAKEETRDDDRDYASRLTDIEEVEEIEAASADVAEASRWTQEHRCYECGAEDPDGWNRKKKYFCVLCCRNRNKKKEEENEEKVSDAKFIAECPTAENPGGKVARHDDMDRANPKERFETKVEVRAECCLSVAREMPGACMLVNGRERGPLSTHFYGQAGYVFRRSTLRQAVQASEEVGNSTNASLPVPRWGGVYVEDVLILPDPNNNEETEHFRMSMCYAAAVRTGKDSEPSGIDNDKKEMAQKIQNVLRICLAHGHTDLILGAWGCGWRGLSAEWVAEAFRDALLGPLSDVAGAFRRVVFAISPDRSGQSPAESELTNTVACFADAFGVERPCIAPSIGERLEAAEEEAEAEVRAADWKEWVNCEDTTRMNAIIYTDSFEELANWVRRSPAVVHMRSQDGRGPLWWAFEYGRPKMIELLRESGADLTATDSRGKSPADMAHKDGVELPLVSGADATDSGSPSGSSTETQAARPPTA